MLHGQRDDHRGKFRTLALVDADGVGRFHLVEFAELVNHPASVEFDPDLARIRVDGGHASDVAVEHFFVIVVARLQDFVARAEFRAEPFDFRTVGPRRIERALQRGVQFPDPEAPAVHRDQNLDVTHRVESEPLGDFLPHQPQHQAGDFLRFLAMEEGEIGALFRRFLRDASVPDIVGRADDAAGFGLAEDFRQAHGRHRATGQQIGEHRARAHAGQLVRIADEKQRSRRREGAAQGGHERHVDHGKFVDHHQVGIERMLRPAFESAAREEFEQAVDGLGTVPGRFAHALGRASGRRAQLEADLFRGENFQQTVEQGGFAHARAAGDDRHTRAEDGAQGLGLAGGEQLAGLCLHPTERLVEIDIRKFRRLGGESLQGRRDGHLGRAQGRQEDGGLAGDVFADQLAVRDLPLQSAGDNVFADSEKLGRLREQHLPGQPGVPLAGRPGQDVLQSAAGPQDGIVAEAEFLAHRVGGFEPDPRNVAGQQVGIGPHARDGLLAVEFEDAQGAARADAVAVEKDHDVAHHALLGPGGLDLLAPPFPDALDFLQAGG